MEKPKINAIICDLDGTLANCSHRLHFVKPTVVAETNRDFPIETTPKKPKKDWKNFYANIAYDEVNEWCRELVFAMYFRNYHIIFCSGRPAEHRDVTLEWLLAKIGPENMTMIRPSLFMRNSGDYRPDNIVKTEIYQKCIEPKYNVLFCIDDRQQVVNAWRELGLTCLQCAPGNF